MSPSTPSLFRLFRRSRYWKPRPGGDEDGSDGHSQRERFAAAAVGLCLKHSPDFRQQFWRTICRSDSDPVSTPDLTMEVEPADWADLRLVAERGLPHRTVWVIEFKLTADLDDKQNPESDVFARPGEGYGALLSSHEGRGDADLRYVVLGSNSLPTGSGFIKSLGIAWQARRWCDLLPGMGHEDGLTTDLFDCLGQLGIPAFRMKEIATHRVEGFGHAAQAWDVLLALAAHYCQNAKQIEANRPAPEHFNIGMYLRSPKGRWREGEAIASIAEHMKPAQPRQLMWIGYESGPEVTGLRRSIWVYCQDEHLAQQQVARLLSVLAGVEITADEDALVISSRPDHRGSDFEWFTSTVEAARKALELHGSFCES